MAQALLKEDIPEIIAGLKKEVKRDFDAVEEYKNSLKNPPFVQFTNPAGLEALELLAQAQPKALKLFMFLCKWMNKQNAVACSQTLLCEALNCSRPTVLRAVKFLHDNRYIGIAKMGTTNVYHLNADLVWSTGFNKKPMAEVQGTILLSLSDQEAQVREKVKRQMSLDFK